MKKLLLFGAAVLAGTLAFSQIGTNTKHARKKPATMAADEKGGGSGVGGRSVDSGQGISNDNAVNVKKSGSSKMSHKKRTQPAKDGHGRDGKTDGGSGSTGGRSEGGSTSNGG